MPGQDVVGPIRDAALGVAGVSAIEKLHVRKAGMAYHVIVHVQTDGATPLDAAHALGGRVKGAICARSPQVSSVLVHMEPYDAPRPESHGSSTLRTSSERS
jgi:divalent metal cation (Fe/Co/Zn/Cd) transporter